MSNDDSVARFDPQTAQWTIYLLPSRGSEVRHIALDDRNGDVWVPYANTSRIARLQFRTEQQLQALKMRSMPAKSQPASAGSGR